MSERRLLLECRRSIAVSDFFVTSMMWLHRM